VQNRHWTLIVIGLFLIPSCGCDKLLCANHVVKEIGSPNGPFKAVVFERDCGATTDFSTQVSVLASGEKPANERGNVFIADGNRGKVPVDSNGAINLTVVWKDAGQLEIGYPGAARVFRKAPDYKGVRVSYVAN
jgi:hypothetical protein